MKMQVSAVLLSLFLLAGCAFAHDGDKGGSRLSLGGEGKVNVDPDVGYIVFGVVTDAVSASEALTANETAMKKVMDGLKELEVSQKDIKTSNFTITRKYEYKKDQEPKEVGYVVANTVNLTICDLSKMGKILDAVVKDGANRVSSVSFGVKDSQELVDKARKEALADAVRKAKLYSSAGHFKLVKIVSLSESGGGYAPRNVYHATDRSRSDVSISPGQIILTANVSVVWEIAPSRGFCERKK